MSTSPSTTTGRHTHPPPAVIEHAQRPARRVSALDRLALHLGIALIKWGRRTHAAATRDEVMHRREQQSAQAEREQAAERQFRLTVPLR